ncbi:MAG: hypothetical protein R6U31_03795 [bacterium]
MFETLTMAKLYLEQKHYSKALDIIEKLMEPGASNELLFLKAKALEGLDRNEEAEHILYELMDEVEFDEEMSVLLEKIYTKTGKKPAKEEYVPPEEIAAVYERLGDTRMAILYYQKKIDELRGEK